MKVLQIVKSLGRGGAEMLLQETLKLHDHTSFEFHYIYFLPWKNQMVQGIEKAGGKVVNFPAKNNLLILLKIPSLIRYIRTNKIELIHCHLPWAGFAGRIVHKITGVPVLYTEHNIQNRYHYITRIINKITFNWQSGVIAVSNDVAESIYKTVKPQIKIHTILNGVNTDEFIRTSEIRHKKRKELGLEDGQILIGTVAVFRFQKRLMEWLEIITAIRKKFPQVKACIAGDGPLKNEILEHVKKYGLEDHVIMPGLQSDVKPWLSAFDIFMMRSSFEGLPIAMLEAMSMQCAIVSTDAGGIKELIRNGTDGLLESVQDWKKLEEPLERLLRNSAQIEEYGKKARNRVVEAYSMSFMVEQLEQLYRSTVKK